MKPKLTILRTGKYSWRATYEGIPLIGHANRTASSGSGIGFRIYATDNPKYITTPIFSYTPNGDKKKDFNLNHFERKMKEVSKEYLAKVKEVK